MIRNIKSIRFLFTLLCTCLCVLALLCPLLMVLPRTVCAASGADGGKVVDMAGLLDSEKWQVVKSLAEDLSTEWNMSFVVVTTTDAEGKSSQDFADDYYDEHGYGEDGVLYLIDLDNRNVWISTAGTMIRYLTDERIDRIIDAGYDNLGDGDYGDGLLQMMEETEYYLNQGIPQNQYNEDVETGERDYYQEPKQITGTEILLAVAAALVCGGAFFLSVNGTYKMKRKSYQYPYWEKAKVHFNRRDDIFIRQTVTRRHIPKNPPPSGGGGGGGLSSVHMSGGGISHGGGGRSL